MRPIKFRAWDTGYGRYLYSDEFQNLVSFFAIIEGDKKRFGKIEQFTGLIDKNGKEIWEGDVVHSKWNEKYVGQDDEKQIVYWSEKEAAWCMNDKGKDVDLENYHLRFHCHPKHIKVIGNIYENPELLA